MTSSETVLHEADVLVIGGGAAGCMAAIKAKEAGATMVAQLDKGHVGRSGPSAFAAGIIQAFCPEEDDYDVVFRGTVEQAGYMVDQDRLRFHLEMSWPIVEELVKFGVEVERDEAGKIRRHPGRGLIQNIMFHGPQMMKALSRETIRRGIQHFNKTMMTDLLTRDGQVVGALAFDIITGEWHLFQAKATIITGSTCYKGMNPGQRDTTADGQVAAYRAGCDVTNLDLPQTHFSPARYDDGPGMHMYVGVGGKFINAQDERFMEIYYPEQKERVLLVYLVPTAGIEVRLGNGPIYLDMTHLGPEQVQLLKRVLPLPMLRHERAGSCVGDRFVKKIEWVAATGARVKVGGPLVNSQFETRLPGLYAAGDAVPWAGFECGQLVGAFTGGAKAGESAARFAGRLGPVLADRHQAEALRRQAMQPLARKDGVEPDQVLLAIQDNVFPYKVLLIREEERMKKALSEVEGIRDNLVPYLHAYDPHYLRMALEAKNLVTLAEMQLRASLARKETRIGGVREDYPYTDNINWLKWVSVEKDDGGMRVFTQDLPMQRYPVKAPAEKALDPVWQAAVNAGRISIREGRVAWE